MRKISLGRVSNQMLHTFSHKYGCKDKEHSPRSQMEDREKEDQLVEL